MICDGSDARVHDVADEVGRGVDPNADAVPPPLRLPPIG